MTHFYLYRADLLKGWPRVWKMTDTAIEKRTREQKRAFVEYVADYLPERLIIDNAGVVRIPTEQEKYDLDPASYHAPDGMYVHEGQVHETPEQPLDMLVPVFDATTATWIETASP
ncbi:hypothetical protein, partial [Aeromonas enteropelogenes]|uniref:hypothetical protein n=1 Tax=Aeromonas enteropelogenes TaxID=29489 RepID=UPI003B9DDCAD